MLNVELNVVQLLQLLCNGTPHGWYCGLGLSQILEVLLLLIMSFLLCSLMNLILNS